MVISYYNYVTKQENNYTNHLDRIYLYGPKMTN